MPPPMATQMKIVVSAEDAPTAGQRRFTVVVADDCGVYDGIGLLEKVADDHRQGEFQKRPRGPFSDQIVGSGFQDSRFLPQVIIPLYHTECGGNCQAGAQSCTPSMILMKKRLIFAEIFDTIESIKQY